MTSHIYDLIIIGSGPAGLAAAVYAQRACLDTLVIEGSTVSGGQILNTYEVDNYPGYPGISGYELGMKLREHADHLGAQFKEDTVLKIEDKGLENLKQVIGMNENYEARTLILATGAVHKKLGIPGEKELTGAGVSYCATCDGAFFRNRTVAVIGGGDVAVEDAIFLSRMCSKGNVVILWNTEAEAIKGDGAVESLLLQDHVTGEKKEISLQGVFIAVGIQPETAAFEGVVDMEQGYIKAGEAGITSVPGIYAAGDVRTKKLRQIVTAAADGANAVTSAEQYLSDLKRG